jgi:hypothetical protein
MRTAIDEFHRDTVGMNCTAAALTRRGTGGERAEGRRAGAASSLDPLQKVVILIAPFSGG